jgi:hypothetical protein
MMTFNYIGGKFSNILLLNGDEMITGTLTILNSVSKEHTNI